MWNIPSKQSLDQIPRLYETENIPLKDKTIFLHMFIGQSDWFVAEYDGEDLFWGFAVINNDLYNAEWGYFSFSELKKLRVGFIQIDCELDWAWQIRPAGKVGLICKAQGW